MAEKKMGRPKKQIDQTQFEKLCGIMCTLGEIAGIFSCSEDTIERWCKETYKMTFAETFKIYSANGKASLRRMQFKLAERNAAMAIFLGKNYLGQKDAADIEFNPESLRKARELLEGVESVID